MSRHLTISEFVWPLDEEDADLPLEWARGVAEQVLSWVWRGYDQLSPKLNGVDFSQPLEQVERNLAELHFYEIQTLWAREGGYSSVHPGHEISEFLSRSEPRARPPAYDLCFTHVVNANWKWPVEAKVLQGQHAVAEYLKDVRGKFVAGIAAPLVGEGAMVGYLLKGAEQRVFEKLTEELGQELLVVASFAARAHRTSLHSRESAPQLRIHHLVMRTSGAEEHGSPSVAPPHNDESTT